MIKLNNIIKSSNSRDSESIYSFKPSNSMMAKKEDKNLVEAIHHLNAAIDKFKVAAKNGDEKAERMLGKLWFHRIVNKGGIIC